MCFDAFDDLHPETAHQRLSYEKYIDTVKVLQKNFTNSQEIRMVFSNALQECGVDPKENYWDWSPLRIQPGDNVKKNISTIGLPLHRDTWYGNLLAQNNWWAPIFPIEAERALIFYPQFFGVKVENTSIGWNLQEFRKARLEVRRRVHTDSEIQKAYPYPSTKKKFDKNKGMVLIIEPGDILSFSAAHLHGSIPNTSDFARFSTEVRTLSFTDMNAGVGTQNVDSYSTGSAAMDFTQMENGQNLAEALEII